MTLILLKSWTNVFGKKYPVGQLMMVDKILGQFLLDKKIAKEYDEEVSKYHKKVNTDFFKPKN